MDINKKIVVSPDQALKRQIIHAYYNGLTGHPGHDETVRKILERFHWPGGKGWIEQYI